MKTAQIFAEYRDHMGSDLTVVNAARTSFGKESNWLRSGAPSDYPGVVYQQQKFHPLDREVQPVNLTKEDAGLIRYLATGFRTKDWDALIDRIIESGVDIANGDATTTELVSILRSYKNSAQHWAPFAHPHLQLRMKLPIFLARQFVKHQIGGTWSEESRRYMSDEPEFWFPEQWHGRPDDIKQGAEGVHPDSDIWGEAAREHTEDALNYYTKAVAAGIAPEEARMVLPLNTMTTVTWTGSLLFWSRVANQRCDPHAQKAAQELGGYIAGIVQPRFPVSWAALVG